jgi:hypothetical protein
MLRFALLILSLLNVAICFAEFSYRLMLLVVRLNETLVFLCVVARFRKS